MQYNINKLHSRISCSHFNPKVWPGGRAWPVVFGTALVAKPVAWCGHCRLWGRSWRRSARSKGHCHWPTWSMGPFSKISREGLLKYPCLHGALHRGELCRKAAHPADSASRWQVGLGWAWYVLMPFCINFCDMSFASRLCWCKLRSLRCRTWALYYGTRSSKEWHRSNPT